MIKKIVLTIISIYVVFTLYKFCMIFSIYQKAKAINIKEYSLTVSSVYTTIKYTRSDNKFVEEYYDNNDVASIRDIPRIIYFNDIENDKRVRYQYDYNIKKYSARDESSEYDFNNLNDDVIKTLSLKFFDRKSIINYTFNPFCYFVSSNTIKWIDFNGFTDAKLEFNSNGLIKKTKLYNKDMSYSFINEYTYDFENLRINLPKNVN